MPLRVFCGPFQPSLEDALTARLKGRGADAGPVAVVAPSRRMADRLQRLLCLEKGLALLGARFHTFHSLALEALQDSGPPAGRFLGDPLFHDHLVDALLRQRRAAPRPSRGLAAAHRASVRDLVDAGVEPRSFREHFSELALDPADKERLESLLELEELYLERLRSLSILPPSALAREAARAVQEGSALGGYSELLYYGFYDLTGAQAEFFEAVASTLPCAAFFPYRKGHPAFRFAERFYELKLHRGAAPPEQLGFDPRGRALGAALDCLFEPGRSAPLPKPDALRVVSVSGARDALWKAAKEILSLRGRAEDPVAFGDIGIVARALEPYRAAAAEVLGAHAIPFSTGCEEPLLRHPLAKLCLSLLTLGRRDFPVGAVLDLVESPYFRIDRFRGRSTGAALAGEWRALALRLGVHSGWLQWEGKVAAWASKDFELHPAAEQGRGRVVAKEDTAALWRLLRGLRERLAGPPAGGGWKGLADSARALLEEHFRVDAADPQRAAWERVLEAVGSLAAFDLAFPEPSWGDFLEALEERLRRAALPAPPQGRGVRLLDAMDARGESFRVLFLLGLEEGAFPRQVREDPLLRDPVRRLLQEAAGYWIRPKLEGYEEERLLFYLLASSASERLYCVYQRSDEEGKARVPSIYLRELCRACGLDLESASGAPVPRRPYAKLESEPAELLSPKELSLLSARHALQAAPLLEALGWDAGLWEGGLEAAAALGRRGEAGGLDGLIGTPKEYLATATARGLSPSALESLARCPFQFFAARLLGLGEPEQPSARGELSPRTRGELYHSVLREFHERLLASGYWKRPEDGSWRADLEAAVASVFGRRGWRELGVYPLLWESERRRMTARLERFAEKDIGELRSSGLVPALLETPLRAVVEGISLHGRPDRVDLDADGRGFRVVDYKSSRPGSRLESLVLRLRSQQPALYLELARRAPSLGGAEPLATCLRVIEEDGGPPLELDAAAWKALRPDFFRRLQGLVGQIEHGRFLIAPEDGRGGVCEFCGFGAVCRRSHGASRRRAEESKWRAELDELRSGRREEGGEA